jgi:transposase, IS5 family
MQNYMAKAQKNRASKRIYISQNQLSLEGFETPFSRFLRKNNRWVELANKLPWDILVSTYLKQMRNGDTGADGINPRIAIGAMIIKHMCDLSDRETVQQIQENVYMQYFIGYTSFSDEIPFDPSLFVNFRKRLGIDQINEINEKILGVHPSDNEYPPGMGGRVDNEQSIDIQISAEVTHKGKLITDATACPQDIAYPTDLNILNDAREKSEQIIDLLYSTERHGQKPRTYRKIARKDYLKTAQKKTKSSKEIRVANKKQLGYLKRNISHINKLLDAYQGIPLDKKHYKYLLVIQEVYRQQNYMHKNRVHSVDHRIVSIHQPHVRPIVRGKSNAKTEFGSKINVSLMNGYAFLDELSWEAYNEGQILIPAVENYKKRFGYYPEEVMADKIYCNRTNRTVLKEQGIRLRAKPLGRPKAVTEEHVRPGERNPIEGKFGQAKTAYGMNRIKARLQQTSESWIATIILVLNLVKMAGEVSIVLLSRMLTFSAKDMSEFIVVIRIKLIGHWKFQLVKTC